MSLFHQPALLHPEERKAIAAQIKADINEYCLRTYDDGHRSHLGASLIGDVCGRRIWYGWRWVKSNLFDGRMQRLFNRGHKEEARWIEWLKGIGFTIWSENEDGTQFRIAGVEGHFGGSLDSVGQRPLMPGQSSAYDRLARVGPFLVEYKTYNRKTFDKLLKDGVQKTKPNHWVQMCLYGAKNKIRYALYCPICKDDDDIEPELVELDWSIAAEAERKAETIILERIPPRRYSEDATNFECKMCNYRDICHKGAKYEINCRSCRFAVPVKGGQWYCENFGNIIPKDFIPKGCSAHKEAGRNN
jgi:hypothetical protein